MSDGSSAHRAAEDGPGGTASVGQARQGRVYQLRPQQLHSQSVPPAPATTPTEERRRHATRQGGVARLEIAGSGEFCHGVRYPLLIDYLRDAGRLAPRDHGVAMRVRELYERTSFRAHVTSSYRERTGRSASDPDREDADDRYRRLDARVLRRAGKDAWTAMRAIVIEDRMTPSARFLTRALAEAERWL